MKVALVIQHADPARGGAEKYTLDIARALSHRGHDVAILASSFANIPWETRQTKIEGRGFTRLSAYLRFLHNLEQHLLGTNYDIVHGMLPVRWCDLYHPHAGIAAETIETGHLKYEPGFRQKLAQLGTRLNRKRQKTAEIEKFLLTRRNPPLVICLSNYVKQTVRKHYPLKDEDLATLFNAIDLRRFDPTTRSDTRPQTRQELNIKPDKVIALMVAQDFHRKGLREAILALAKVKDEHLVLVVVGKGSAGPYRRQAITLGVDQQIIFAGATDDIVPYYRAADFFVLPTRHDPCSLAVLEALAMGLPAIAGRCSGAAEILRHGDNGWICDPNDVAGLAKLMHAAAQVASDEKRCTDARASARRTAEGYGIDDMARKLTELYATLA